MAETQGKQQGKKSIARNRSARHEYEIGETFECGLVLTGTEVKSLRERGCQLTDTFCLIRDGEAWIHGMHLHPYTNGANKLVSLLCHFYSSLQALTRFSFYSRN